MIISISTGSFYKKKLLTTRKFLILISCLFVLTGYSVSIFANNTWTLVGDLNAPRAYHSATTINATQILVAGGDSAGILVSSAEIFSLSNSQWNLTGSMNQARQNHAAVLLNDGRVLVAGGNGASSDLASAEVYNPATGNWTTVASMSTARASALITKLQDGRVLVSGGSFNGEGLLSAEIYDPASNSWMSTSAMLHDTTHTNAAALLNDGRVFIKGHAGYSNNQLVDIPPSDPFYPEESPTKLPQIFDPATNVWSTVSAMNTPKLGGTSVVLGNGNVLVIGGEIFQEMYWGYPYFHCNAPAEIYDPNTDTWTETGMQASSGLNPSKVSLLPDGNVLAFGPSVYFNPYSACGSDYGQTDIYDVIAGSWSATDSAALRHHLGGANAALADGKVLTIGGGDEPQVVEIYTPSGVSPEPPPRAEVIHIGDIDGEAIDDDPPGGFWRATVTFYVEDQDGQPVEGADVHAFSSTGQTLPDICTTDASGHCTQDQGSTTGDRRVIWVTDIVKTLTTYDSTLNTDPDGDSDGTTIVIEKPVVEPPPPPPVPSSVHVADLDGASVKKGKRRWQAIVSIKVVDQDGNLRSNAEVSGNWSGGTSGSSSCSTDSYGNCQVTSNQIRNSKSTATFAVTDVVDPQFDYDSGANSDADNDSDGTSITVSKP